MYMLHTQQYTVIKCSTFDEDELPSLLQDTVSKIESGLSPATIFIGRKRFIATRIKPWNITSFVEL